MLAAGVPPPNANVGFGASAAVVEGFVLALERPGLLEVWELRPENKPPALGAKGFVVAGLCAGFEGANDEVENPPLVPPNGLDPGV